MTSLSVPPLVARAPDLAALCQRLSEARAPIAIDTEFLTERRYAPRLCLVQIYADAPGDPIEALVDPFGVALDPLLPLLADPDLTKIVHSGGQDLSIFAGLGAAPQGVFDTQIAAAFLGFGHQIGYADMVRRMTGESLSKAQQFTDWAARPLSTEQRLYAIDDVRYLPGIAARLKADLEARGRLGWAQAEFRRLESKAATPLDELDLLRKFNLSGLSRRQLALLSAVAAWRESVARRSDKPATFIVPDATLLQLAKHPPATLNELRSTRGLPGMAAAAQQEILSALEAAAKLPNEQLPQRALFERPDPRAESVANLLSTLAAMRADDEQISRGYLAPRDQLTALANWWLSRDDTPPALPLLSDWRRELLGDELLNFLNGATALTIDPRARLDSTVSAVRVTPAPQS